jgi:hypothetical protein
MTTTTTTSDEMIMMDDLPLDDMPGAIIFFSSYFTLSSSTELRLV